MDDNKRIKKIFRFSIGSAVIIIVGTVFVYFVLQPDDELSLNHNAGNTTATAIVNLNNSNVNNSNNINSLSNPPGWQTYENIPFGYSVKYPPDYSITLEVDGNIFFDREGADAPDLTPYTMSVAVEKTDLSSRRLAILTDLPYDVDSGIFEDTVVVSNLDGIKIAYTNNQGESVTHYLVSYLGTVYDVLVGGSVDSNIIDTFIANFDIRQLDEDIDIANTEYFDGRTCISNNDCGAFPCVNGECLVKKCTCSCHCPGSVCGGDATPVPGYCTTIDTS